jgi:NAD(P)H dehydrogenase (quinone)
MANIRILILYYSMYGNVFQMAQAIAEGVGEVPEAEPLLRQAPDLLPEKIMLENEGVRKAKEMQKDIPVAVLDDLRNCDGLILGAPTRYGNMCGQMRNFLDQTGSLWQEGALAGKPAGLFTSTATMHGGQETTLISMSFTLLHHGMLIAGVPYTVPELLSTKTGGTPYGASHVAGMGLTPLSKEEKEICRMLGKRVAEITKKIK